VASDAADVSTTGARARRVVGGASLIVALDVLTKVWAVAALSDGPISIVGDFVELRLTRNPGGAFGRFQGMTVVLALAAIAITVLLVRELRRTTDRVLFFGLTLVLGGALGNLVDRVFRSPGVLRGHVVDFVSVGDFPVFNVADSCITIGAIVLVLRTLRAPVPATKT